MVVLSEKQIRSSQSHIWLVNLKIDCMGGEQMMATFSFMGELPILKVV